MFQSKGFPTGEEPCHDPIKTRVSNSEYIFSDESKNVYILALQEVSWKKTKIEHVCRYTK